MVENKSKKAKAEEKEIVDSDFKNFRLKRVTKENHGTPINQIKMGFDLNQLKNFKNEDTLDSGAQPTDLSHLALTISSSQINIYDNEHYGDHLDLMCHFKLPEEERIGDLKASCWLERPGDALVAFGGKSGQIHLVSIAFSQEFARIEAHEGDIIELLCHPVMNNILLSCSLDGTVKLWDTNTKNCIVKIDYSARAAAFGPNGETLLLGNSKGDIEEFYLPSLERLVRTDRSVTDLEYTTRFPAKHHNGSVDCIALIDDKVVSKSRNGNVFCWFFESGEIISKFRIRNSSHTSCKFGISPNKRYICVGSELGAIYIHSLMDGKMLSELRNRRSTKAITSCTFACGGRNVLCSNIDGYLLRFDYISDSTLKEWEAWAQA